MGEKTRRATHKRFGAVGARCGRGGRTPKTSNFWEDVGCLLCLRHCDDMQLWKKKFPRKGWRIKKR